MPEQSFTVGGDLSVGGGIAGRDTIRHEERHEREIERMAERVGRNESDFETLRLQVAIMRERYNLMFIGLALLSILSGAVAVIVARLP